MPSRKWLLVSQRENARPDRISDRIVIVGASQEVQYCNNSIKTSKYEWWNFLPKFLLEEFNPKTKFANCYFLVICGLQVVPQITNTNQYPTTLIPLLGVLIIAGVLKAVEDIERHKADKAANSSLIEVLDRDAGQFVSKKCSEVLVGDFVRVKSRQIMPADILLVQVWEPNPELPKGSCYIETKSLDGETNLKHRSVLPALLGKITSEKSLLQLQGRIVMENPNPLIDHFTGVLELSTTSLSTMDIAIPNPSSSTTSAPALPSRIPISPTNVILRGCVLRSTEFMIGLVLNTGHDVKIMQSKILRTVKSSKLEHLATIQLVSIIALLLLLCLCMSVAQYNFNQYWQIESFWYLSWNMDAGTNFVIRFFSTLLLHSSFVPVALYVSMALLRFGQAFFMQWDLGMFHDDKNLPMSVRTMNLNEELGQITHIFSDKTGTLTSNNMNFRKASIQGISYGKGITEIGKAAWRLQGKRIPPEMLEAEELASRCNIPHVSFYCPDFDRDYLSAFSKSMKGNQTPTSEILQSDTKLQSIGVNGLEMVSNKAAVEPVSSMGYETHLPTTHHHHRGGYADKQKQLGIAASVSLQKEKIKDFYRYLSVCHEVIPERLEDGEIKLSAPNPDDEALVCAAAYFGYEFKDRRDRFAIIYDKEAHQTFEIEILYAIPFTSARKRMSVIIRDIDHKIKIITKGSDAMILSRADPNDAEMNRVTAEHVNQYSQEGLRCLMVAMAVIEEENFQGWSKHYDEANTDLSELEKKKRGEENDIEVLEDLIERSLHIIGATGIEDRLQEGVPETIETLLQAGFKLWVLTGDKEETAINIAIACNLLLPSAYMDHVIINLTIAPDLRKAAYILRREIARYMKDSNEGSSVTGDGAISTTNQDPEKLQEYDHVTYSLEDVSGLPEDCKPRALIIDGPSLIPLMKDTKCRNLLLLFTQCCQAVVCCRVSPDQKREILDLVKDNIPGVRALAIGDGANDVAMISSAHIGVGIKGEEGVQAVNASDYAIGRFRFLSTLLLKHGRYNYIRMSTLICFMLYKNIFMSMTMYWYNFYSGYSNSKFFTEAGIQFYNLFYTSLPVVIYAITDQDIRPEMALHFPQIYRFNIRDDYFNFKVVWNWVFHSFIESAFISVLPLYLLQNYDVTYDGVFASQMEAGAVAFTAVVIIVNLKLLLFQRNWNLLHIFIIVLSIGSWFIIAYAANLLEVVDFNFFYVWNQVLPTGVFWLSLLLLVGGVGLKDLIWATSARYLFYRPYHILQEIDRNENFSF